VRENRSCTLGKHFGIAMESGLRNIYLHHAYFPSVLTHVECHAHANITGGNGAGKTTLLSLIPIFYGLEPNKMVSKAANKLSFVGHYLPSSKSMIVFEYVRVVSDEPQVCCVVLYQSQNSLIYRFAKGAAADVLFSDTARASLQNHGDVNQWLMYDIDKTTSVSKQIKTTKDYRAVIQNNRHVLRQKRQRGDSLVGTALEFSLCDPAYEMKHVESISSVLMRHDRLLAQFKTMVVDSFLADQIELSDSPFRKDDADYLESLQALIELDKYQDRFEQTLEHYAELKEAWSRLLAYQQYLDSFASLVSAKIQQADEQLIEQKQQRDTTDERLSALIEELSLQYNELSTQLNVLNDRINHLHDKRDYYDNTVNIAEKQATYAQRENLLQEFTSAQAHYQNLLDSVSTEKDNHEKQVQAVKAKGAEFRLKLTQQNQTDNTALAALQLDIERWVNSRNETTHQQAADYRQSREQQQSELNAKLRELAVDVAQSRNFTDEEQAVLANIDEHLSLADDKLAEQQIQLKDLRHALKDNQQQHHKKNEALKQKTAQLEKLNHQREQLYMQLNPSEGSLREFLNQNVSGWQHSFGKLIRPELLDNRKLAPSSQPNASPDTVFGVNLNLEPLEVPPEARSDELLKQQLQDVEKSLVNVEDDIKKLRAESNQLTLAETELKQQQNKLERHIEQLNTEKEQLRLSQKQEKAKYETERAAREAQCQQRYNEAETQLSQFNQNTAQRIAELERASQHLIMEYRATQSAKEAEIEEKIRSNEQAISDSELSDKQKIKELQSAFKDFLQQKGIDPKTEQKAKSRMIELEQRYEEAKSYAAIITEFETWEKSQWQQINQHEADAAALSAKADNADTQHKQAQQEKRNELQRFNVEIKRLRTLLEDHDTQRKQLRDTNHLIEQKMAFVPVGHPAAELEAASTTHLLVSQATDTAQQVDQLLGNIRSAVRKVDTILVGAGSKNKVSEMWSNIKEAITQQTGKDELAEDFYLDCIQGLEKLVRNTVPDVRQLTIEHIRTVGESYVRFYHTLDGLKRKVNQVSKKLASEINTANSFPDLDNIQVELVSKIEEYAIWRELSGFNAAWERWGEQGRENLPDSDFLNAFQAALDGMKAGGIESMSKRAASNAANKASRIEPLVGVNIALTENGREVIVRNDEDLRNASSTGLSKLAIIVVFCGMTRYLCADPNVRIHWPLDELGQISNENISLLFNFMDQHNINLFCAQPNPNEILRKFFAIKSEVKRGQGIERYRPPTHSKTNLLLSGTNASASADSSASSTEG